MEKFAVDLDKVLDDFELNEDEKKDPALMSMDLTCNTKTSTPTLVSDEPSLAELSKNQYSLSNNENTMDANSSANVENFNLGTCSTDPESSLLNPGIRSPPDGQNDDINDMSASHCNVPVHGTSLFTAKFPDPALQDAFLKNPQTDIPSSYSNTLWSTHKLDAHSCLPSRPPETSTTGALRAGAVGASSIGDNFRNSLGAVGRVTDGADADLTNSTSSGITARYDSNNIPAIREVFGGSDDSDAMSDSNKPYGSDNLNCKNQSGSMSLGTNDIIDSSTACAAKPSGSDSAILVDVVASAVGINESDQVQKFDEAVVPPAQNIPFKSELNSFKPPDVVEISQASEIQAPIHEIDNSVCYNASNLDVVQDESAYADGRACVKQSPLPDLMAGNTECTASYMDPVSNDLALLDKSSFNCQSSEPALVQENQSVHRFPEIVDIHKTYEARTTFDNENQEISINHENLQDDSSSSSENSNDSGHKNHGAVSFDPNSCVGDIDLDAELQELEEEQANLQGAYAANHANDSLQHHGSNFSNNSFQQATTQCTTIETRTNQVSENEPIGEHEPTDNIVVNPVLNITSTVNQDESSAPPANSNVYDNGRSIDEYHSLPVVEIENINKKFESSTEFEDTTNGEDHNTTVDSNVFGELAIDRGDSAAIASDYENESNLHSHSETSISSDSVSTPVLGDVAPFWVPDEDSLYCQECGVKFTLVRRRHHCRACGRVLCAQCCKDKAPLAYMHYKEARVCITCKLILDTSQENDNSSVSNMNFGPGMHASGGMRSPDPNNPMEYCSRIPPLQQASNTSGSSATPTIMVPVGVLKRDDGSGAACASKGGKGRNSSKQVIFSDGIRPGGDLSETSAPAPLKTRSGRIAKVIPGLGGVKPKVRGDACLLPAEGGLPPILLERGKGHNPEYVPSGGSSEEQKRLFEQMTGEGPPVLFAVNKNLTVVVKLVKLECCVGVKVWSVATRGLCCVGQEEIILLLEALPDENQPPVDIFAFFYSVYQQANKGNLVSELGHTILTEPDGFLGSRDHGGFLYVRPTFQCLHNLPLPQPPFLFALLIHKWETPWAKVFPLRLLLRLGAEFRYYPCPLVSTRNRKPVFSEIGHTIMNLLVDFRNYAYTIPGIQGLVVHMEDKKTTLYIPRNRYTQVTKALRNSNDHVLALAANFSPLADSHLVTIENDEGQYSTQAINIHRKPRKVTGASFVVFNGALKSNCGLTAKSTIVEDGLMVQITSDVMSKLRDSLQSMKDFNISCGVIGEPPQEEVLLHWTEDDTNYNIGVRSPVDGKALDGVPSVKVHAGTDYVSNDFLIRWTEVFILQGESSSSSANDINLSRIWEELARGFCVALTPYLQQLYLEMNTHLGLRATIHHQNVGYDAGSGGNKLTATACLNSLDSELVPVIHRAAASVTHDPLVLELFFHILQQ